MKQLKSTMISLLAFSLGGLIVPIIKFAFTYSIVAGIFSIVCSICLLISAGWLVINGDTDN